MDNIFLIYGTLFLFCVSLDILLISSFSPKILKFSSIIVKGFWAGLVLNIFVFDLFSAGYPNINTALFFIITSAGIFISAAADKYGHMYSIFPFTIVSLIPITNTVAAWILPLLVLYFFILDLSSSLLTKDMPELSASRQFEKHRARIGLIPESMSASHQNKTVYKLFCYAFNIFAVLLPALIIMPIKLSGYNTYISALGGGLLIYLCASVILPLSKINSFIGIMSACMGYLLPILIFV